MSFMGYMIHVTSVLRERLLYCNAWTGTLKMKLYNGNITHSVININSDVE